MDEKIIIVPIPSLISLLVNAERTKGSELTEKEVTEIAENCTCITLKHSDFIELTKSRGYQDISPEYAWENWLAVKEFLLD